MNRRQLAALSPTRFHALAAPIACFAALALSAGSAFGAIASTSNPDRFGNPFENPEGFLDDPADLPVLPGENPGFPGSGPDYRSHSDVPDLPDSSDDQGSESNALFFGDPYPTPSWAPQEPGFDFSDVLADGGTLAGSDGPFLAPSPIPAPGGIGVLTVLAAAAVARRRR